jgi:hypothetical protein
MSGKNTGEKAQQPSDDDAGRITRNLLRCAELTELCLQLRFAVLRQQCSEKEARRRFTAEILEAKARAWQKKLT